MFGALTLFFFAASGVARGRAAVQLIGVILLAFSLFFMIRAVTVHIYAVIPDKSDGAESDISSLEPRELLFTVSKKFGKAGREVCRCSIPLDRLVAVRGLPADYGSKKKIISEFGKTEQFSFVSYVGKSEATLLVFKNGAQNKIALLLDSPKDMGTMYSYLKQTAHTNNNSGKDE